MGTGSIANIENTVSIGKVGAERKLVNLANGTIASGSTDAVNGGQLYTANQRVAAAFGTTLDASGQLVAPSYTIQGTAYDNAASAFSAVNAALTSGLSSASQYVKVNSTATAATASGTDAVAIGGNAQATATGSIAIGLNSASTGTNAIAIGAGAVAAGSVAVGAAATASNGGAAFGDGAVATGTNSAALGTNASATAANSVAIGSGSTNTVANTVSFGSAGNERRLTNVAAGINATDAVNVGQLQSTVAGFQSQIGSLQTQITANQQEARRGIVAAVSAAPTLMPSAPGKTTVAVNTGYYRGQSGVGIGISHRLNWGLPTVVFGGYSNGGGSEHVGRAGMAVEF
ncbi:YadA-like family protein [Bradyrhizobium cajani]|nr:YadA-like family protein [Bradyrhizobium cajani]